MKILGKNIGKRGGWNCDAVDENGIRICRRFELDKNNIPIKTGTEIGLSVDPETCEPIFHGDVNLMDDDEDKIGDIVKKMTSKCRKEKGF